MIAHIRGGMQIPYRQRSSNVDSGSTRYDPNMPENETQTHVPTHQIHLLATVAALVEVNVSHNRLLLGRRHTSRANSQSCNSLAQCVSAAVSGRRITLDLVRLVHGDVRVSRQL